MANWEKLNKEFDDLFDSFQDSDWDIWENNRLARKEMRRLELLMKAKIQEEKLKFVQLLLKTRATLNESIVTHNDQINILTADDSSCSDLAGENNFALAA